MTQRKRKPPEKKPARKPRGLISRAASALMGAVVRRPAQSGGIAAFVVVFGVVAANALGISRVAIPSPSSAPATARISPPWRACAARR